MSSFTASQEAPEELPPSLKSLLEDSNPPTTFNMKDWTRVRNFLYYFGKLYRHTIRVNSNGTLSFPEPRAILFDIGRAMNEFQEDYGSRLSQVSLQGRLIAEGVVEFFAPPAGYDDKAMIGEKIYALSNSSHVDELKFKSIILPSLRSINGMGVSGVHITRGSLKPNDKSIMSDNIFKVTSYLVQYVESKWVSESAEINSKIVAKDNAKEWQTAEEKRIDEVTDLSLWLKDNGLSNLEPHCIANGIDSLEILMLVHEDASKKPDEQDAGLKAFIDGMKLGERLQFKKKKISSEDVFLYEEKVKATLTQRMEVETVVNRILHERRMLEEEQLRSERESATRRFKTLSKLAGHKGYVLSVSISPDATKIISAGLDNVAKVWDIRTSREITTLWGHTSYINIVCMSPDGNRIFTASSDKTIKVWDSLNFSMTATIQGHTCPVTAMCISPSGSKLITGSRGRGTMKVWDAHSYAELVTLTGHQDDIETLCTSPDGLKLISGSVDCDIIVWDLFNYEILAKLIGHRDWVTSLSVSPDCSTLFSGSNDGSLKLWDLSNYAIKVTINGHTSCVKSMCVTSDCSRLISGSVDHTIKVWDLDTYKEIVTMHSPDAINSVCVSPDNKLLVSACSDKQVYVWGL